MHHSIKFTACIHILTSLPDAENKFHAHIRYTATSRFEFDVSTCLLLGRTDPYLEHSISCHLIPKKVSMFQVRSTESDDTISSWSMFEL
jgi:hypothetical protein